MDMKRVFQFVLLGSALLLAAACSKTSAESMQQMQKIEITPTPEVLEAVGGKVPVTFTIKFPKGYFYQDAMMIITPVLVYDGGQATGKAIFYQGERIKDNYKTVSVKGAEIKEYLSFDFVPGMEKSHLELRPVILFGATKYEVPAIKVADGCNTTYMLADLGGTYSLREDGYKEVYTRTEEGQILYDVNSAKVKRSQLRSESIRDYQEGVAAYENDGRAKVKGTQIVAYASPEGGKKLNDKLSDNRAASAEKAWEVVGEGRKAELEVKSIGQDWEGFQDAVAKSDIEDKNLILRVLSMYSDPAVRESEIRNMSAVYGEIKKEVFPELRRARFITEIEYQNYTEEELKQLAENQIYKLDEPGILRAAANETDFDRKGLLYRFAYERYGSQKALYNLAVIYVDKGVNTVAESYLDRMDTQDDPDVLNLRGVIAMRKGDVKNAEDYFEHAASREAVENLGTLYIMTGDYKAAAEALKDSDSRNRALAYILSGDLQSAEKSIDSEDPRADYFRAIIAARSGHYGTAKSIISGLEGDYRTRAAKDIEFAKVK